MSTSAASLQGETRLEAGRGLRIGLWTVQVLLAAVFAMGGLMKMTTPLAEMAVNVPWVTNVGNLVRFIGAAEFAGALGLLLPALTRIRPVLTPYAALGLAAIMALAAVFHLFRGEFAAIGVNFIIGALALFVAWGRLFRAPIPARS